jgi:FkbM family methyltransferase
MPDVVARVLTKYPSINIHQAVISETDNENISFHVTNNGQSSSILAFGTHQQHHPHVHVTHTIPLQTTRLDTLIREKQIPIDTINFLNLDIQGMELSALKSMESYLNRIDYIYTEVNTENVYEGVPLIGEMDAYLSSRGFKRVTQFIYTQFGWGDAFYMRSQPSS